MHIESCIQKYPKIHTETLPNMHIRGTFSHSNLYPSDHGKKEYKWRSYFPEIIKLSSYDKFDFLYF